MQNIFISATDTNVGKTFLSSLILKELSKQRPTLDLAYYKPMQCGLNYPATASADHSKTDLEYIQNNCPKVSTYNSYFLEYPAAPLVAANNENKTIDIEVFKKDFGQITKNHDFVLSEGAGGLAVPINNSLLVSDLILELQLSLVLIIRADLGTLNHSLLSIEHAVSKGIKIAAVFMNTPSINGVPGTSPQAGELDLAPLALHIKTVPEIIQHFTGYEVFTSINKLVQKLCSTQ